MRLPASLALTSLLLLPLIFAEPALAESRLEQLEALIAATAKGSPRQSPEVMQSLIEAAGAEMKTLSLKALLDACEEIDPESLVRNDEATHDAHVLMYISNHISQRLAGGDDPAPLLQMPLANEPFGRIACRLFALSQYKVHPKASEEKWIPAETLVATLALARALEENDEARKLTMSPALLRYQTLIEITRRKIPVDLADEYATAKRRYLQSNSPGERRVQLKIMQLTGGDQLSDDVAAIARELLAGDARLQATPDVKDLLKLLARSDSPAAAAILRRNRAPGRRPRSVPVHRPQLHERRGTRCPVHPARRVRTFRELRHRFSILQGPVPKLPATAPRLHDRR
jgi:hypothetical protein